MAKTPKKTISDVPMTLERAAVLIDRLQKQLSMTNIALYDLEARVTHHEQVSQK